MKNVFAAVALAVMIAGAPAAPGQSNHVAGQQQVSIAVIEFTPVENATVMTAEARRQLQASIAFSLADIQPRRFDVYDVRRTREASGRVLQSVNDESSTEAAVEVGKQIGVSYVLTGMVTDYTVQGEGGFGYATLRARLVEVATGNVAYSDEIVQKGSSEMRSRGATEMHEKVLRPAIETLTGAILAQVR